MFTFKIRKVWYAKIKRDVGEIERETQSERERE